MKKKTKIFLALIAFFAVAVLLVIWLILPMNQITKQAISYESFLNEEEKGNIYAIYFSPKENAVYGQYTNSIYSIDQLPNGYDFVVIDVERDAIMQIVTKRFNDHQEQGFSVTFYEK